MQSRTMQQRLSKGGCGTHCWIVLTRRADNRNTRPASPNQEFQTLATQIVITGDNSNGTHDSFDMTVAPIPVQYQGTPCKPGNGFLICPDLLQQQQQRHTHYPGWSGNERNWKWIFNLSTLLCSVAVAVLYAKCRENECNWVQTVHEHIIGIQ